MRRFFRSSEDPLLSTHAIELPSFLNPWYTPSGTDTTRPSFTGTSCIAFVSFQNLQGTRAFECPYLLQCPELRTPLSLELSWTWIPSELSSCVVCLGLEFSCGERFEVMAYEPKSASCSSVCSRDSKYRIAWSYPIHHDIFRDFGSPYLCCNCVSVCIVIAWVCVL